MVSGENPYFAASISVQSERILYTPSSFARESLFHLQEVGSLKALRGHTSRREGLQSFLCFVVEDGTGDLTFEGKRYPLETGDVVFLDCRKPYSHSTGEHLWSLRWCHFSGEAIPAIYKKYLSRGGQPVFHPEDAAPFSQILKLLYETASSEDYIRDMRIHSQLSVLLERIMSYSWNPDVVQQRPASRVDIRQIKAFLDEHYMEKLSLADLARTFYVDKSYLCKIFKANYGTTVNNYLLSRKITEAKRLLRFSDKSVEEIGLLVGIGEPAYFSRVFRKIEGASPREYRKMW
ncbi:MAG: AraC family transcriptional regulator [Candidatus Faecousia sp.]|nr:AraC family transcriptional regulator [Candidatus Faecousia sp.]